MINLVGINSNMALFSDGARAVVIDTTLNLVKELGSHDELSASAPWAPEQDSVQEEITALAAAALKYMPTTLVSSADRMYTIPGGVQAEAKKALNWRHEAKRGGTPVGLNTARTLARGGQIGIEKIRHIAKYFPRHEVDKKGKGWAPGEEHFPSNGRIAWALWGGDAGQRWASAIVERENKKAMTAGAFDFIDSVDEILEHTPETYASDVDAFKMAHELDPFVGPEFMARVRLDDSGIDRLYKIDIDGQVYLWDGSCWDNMGHVDGDVYAYDRALDDVYDTCEKTHVLIDPSSAVVISAFLQERPFQPVTLDEIDPEEADLMSSGLMDEDFSTIDRVMVAAGEPVSATDGTYTPEERAKNTKSQPRDSKGLFVQVGTKIVVGEDVKRGKGTITSVNEDNGTVSVQLDNGNTVDVDPKLTRPLTEQDVAAESAPVISEIDKPNLSGIVGDPVELTREPVARLSEPLEPMTADEVHSLIEEFPKYVQEQRATTAPVTAAADGEVTPDKSDVTPKYLALVSPDDKAAVMDLVAVVPASKTSPQPAVYVRQQTKWVKNDQILMDLKSPTPPPVIQLKDKEILDDVLVQVDKNSPIKASAYDFSVFWQKVVDPLLAAGGLDRNRGNAEELRQYWTHGKGAAKIRWGTPGDWTRCVRNLAKYMGPRAKGYCQLRHKEATGVYTGSRQNPGNNKGSRSFSTLFASEAEFSAAVVEKSRLSALAADAREKIGLVASARAENGAAFSIPMLVPEGLESGDGRKFENGAISVRELPVPLLWQIKTGAGHDGSVVVGRIDSIERIEGGMGNAYGVFDSGPYGREAERLVRYGFLRGVSVDLDQFEAKEVKEEAKDLSEDGDQQIGKEKLTINKARIMAATIVAKPAFQECSILLLNDGDQEDNVTPEDGVYEESIEDFADAEALTASGFLESDIPVTPPQAWFEKPALTKATPLTVDPDGRVYGHIAAWHVNHIGMPRSTRPPRSRSNYAYFHTGVVRTDAGKDVPVGQLTLAGGHANLNASAAQAAKHYDDTASAIADVHAGEDDYGIWVAGSLRPEANESQIRALRASAPSGDWRPINGQLELVAVCQVNVPGFPIARAIVAGGQVMALVAAGAHYMATLKSSDIIDKLVSRAATLGEFAIASDMADLSSRAAVASEKVWADFAYISRDERMKLAEDGKALPDGSFPIQNVEDLKNAIQSFGRAKDKDAVKKHIKKRARQLNFRHLIPDEWTKESSILASAQLEDLRAKTLTAAAVAEFAKISEEDRKDLAEKGLALPDGSYPIRDEQDLKNAIHAYGRSKKSDRAKVRKHIVKRARKLGVANLIPEEWTTASSNEAAEAVASMRAAITASGEAVVAAAPKVEKISESDLKKLKESKAEADKQTEEEVKIAEDIKAGKTTAKEVYDKDGRSKYVSGVNQPRDAKGKYRTVLARLKQNLGVAGLQDALKKVQSAEDLDFAGNYVESAKASTELLGMIDRIDTKALNPKALENVKSTAAELGKVISNLPLPFGEDAQKVRFSDLPSGLKDLIDSMISRVEEKIGKKDADIATSNLKSFMSGADVYSQAEIQSEMSKLLRLLT